MESIVEQVKQLAISTDDAGRRSIASALRDLSYSLEAPKDTAQRIISYHLRISAVRTGIDLGIFRLLSASKNPLDAEDIARRVGTDASLIDRYLRYFASSNMITETAMKSFSANNTTKALADPGKEATIIHYFDTVGPVYQVTPAFLRSTNFAVPETITDCPFQLAYNTSKSAFDFFPELPAASLDAFNKYMSMRGAEMVSSLSVYPIAEESADCTPEEVLLVDVGGGVGHQCKELRDNYPEVKGRLIVQDLENPISGKVDDAGVEGMVHNFFDEQPIKGARFYYLRSVFHDFPDDRCQVILSRLKEAMNQRSRILIEDTILPDSGVDWAATHTDLTMMACLAAKERTQEQWEELLDRAGLEIENQRTYAGGWGGYECIMTVVTKG